MSDSITFRASLPGIKSAILLDGNGDGGQVKLDVPRSDTGALLLLQNDFAGKSFIVTIESDDNGDDKTTGGRKTKKRIVEGDSGM
jgi:hypothetical protein